MIKTPKLILELKELLSTVGKKGGQELFRRNCSIITDTAIHKSAY